MSNIVIDEEYKTHPFYTHRPFVNEVLKMTTGDILECGCGEGSTKLFRQYIGPNRKLVSVESNRDWLMRYIPLANEYHELYHVPAGSADNLDTGRIWTNSVNDRVGNRHFDIVFIDSSPWVSRTAMMEHFKDKAKVLIVHDFDYFPNHNIYGHTTKKSQFGDKEIIECDLSEHLKNWHLFYPPIQFFAGPTGPPTLIASNTMSDDEFKQMVKTIYQNYWSYYVEI